MKQSNVPPKICSREEREEEEQASEKAGADAYLPKPFPFEDLLAPSSASKGLRRRGIPGRTCNQDDPVPRRRTNHEFTFAHFSRPMSYEL
jgi:DNA-binding response OmpR family regulator